MQQMHFDFWEPAGHKWSVCQMERARQIYRDLEHFQHVNPEAAALADCLAMDEVGRHGTCGSRFIGEGVRSHLQVAFDNGLIAAIARDVIVRNPCLDGAVRIRPCALDAVFAEHAARGDG